MPPRLHDMEACLRVDSVLVKAVAARRDVLAKQAEWRTGHTREIEEGIEKNISTGEAIAASEFLSFNPTVEVFEIAARDCRDFGGYRDRVEFEARSLSHRLAGPIFPCPNPAGPSRLADSCVHL